MDLRGAREAIRRAYAVAADGKPRIRHLIAAWDEPVSILDRILD